MNLPRFRTNPKPEKTQIVYLVYLVCILLLVSWSMASPRLASGDEPKIIARQARPNQIERNEEQEIPSPMLIEMPIAWISFMGDDQRKTITDTRKFWCDDVRVSQISFTKNERKNGSPRWEVSAGLYTRPSDDREVDIKIEVFRGHEVAMRLTQQRISVEEGRNEVVTWRKQEARFSTSGDPWYLRVVLVARED